MRWLLCVRRLSVRAPRPPPSPGMSRLDMTRYSYVDKTDLLARILSDNPDHSAGQFLHAPAMRRIGKSTTIKMLAAMAGGDRELFQGMAVNEPGSPFEIGKTPYSVIQLDFSAPSIETTYNIDQVRSAIAKEMRDCAFDQHGLDISSETPGDVLKEWIRKLKILYGHEIVFRMQEFAYRQQRIDISSATPGQVLVE